jgi:hypothetical protein
LPGVPQGEHQAVVYLDEDDVAGDLLVDRPAEALNIEGTGRRDAADT